MVMEITWYGQACFRLRDRGRTVVTDPYGPRLGLRLPRIRANVVTVSHQHEDHNHVSAIRGAPYVISVPGEYEIKGVFIIGVSTSHDAQQGQQLGLLSGDLLPPQQRRNTAYLIEFDDLSVCHLGNLRHVPNQEQLEQLGTADILLVPIGGRSTLTGTRAAELVGLLEPSIVIPMHYRFPGLSAKLETPRRFLREMGIERPKRIESLRLTKARLPAQTRVILLEPKQ